MKRLILFILPVAFLITGADASATRCAGQTVQCVNTCLWDANGNEYWQWQTYFNADSCGAYVANGCGANGAAWNWNYFPYCSKDSK